MRTRIKAPEGYEARQSTMYSPVYLVKRKRAAPEFNRRIGTVRNIKPRGKQLWEAEAEDGEKSLSQTGASAVAWLCQRDQGTQRAVTP